MKQNEKNDKVALYRNALRALYHLETAHSMIQNDASLFETSQNSSGLSNKQTATCVIISRKFKGLDLSQKYLHAKLLSLCQDLAAQIFRPEVLELKLADIEELTPDTRERLKKTGHAFVNQLVGLDPAIMLQAARIGEAGVKEVETLFDKLGLPFGVANILERAA